MLTQEQIEAIDRESVERHRLTHSDAQLWAMLDERQERMALLSRTMAKIGAMLSTDVEDYEYWQAEVDRYAREYAGHLEFVDLVIWHLERRGLINAAKWRGDWRDFNQASALSWWSIN